MLAMKVGSIEGNPVVSDDDSVLVERAQKGEVAAFEALMNRHRDKVYGLARRMTRSEADAAEITQETFLAAYRTLATFRSDAAFTSWLHRIAANFALMRLRHRKVSTGLEDSIEGPTFNERGTLLDSVADWHANAETLTIDAELRTIIEKASDSLPEDYRQAFLLRDVEGLSYEDIASTTGQTIANVKTRIHRARLAMRAAIDHFYDERS